MPEVLKSIWRDLRCLSPDKKSTLSFAFFLRYCNNITNLLFWVLWAYLAIHKQSDAIKLYKTFVFICRQKNNFIIHIFLEILHRYANFLCWVLWACLATHIQNHTINLWKTLMFICMPKINFITHFFPEILHFKESCNLIGRQHFRPLHGKLEPVIGLVAKYQ